MLKQRIFILLTIGIGALIQQSLPAWPLFGGMKPPILAALVLHYALRTQSRDMWLAVITAALLQDGLDLGTFGPATLAFPIIGMAAHRIKNEVFADGIVTLLFMGAALSLFFTLITLLIFTTSGQRPFHFGQAMLRLFSSAVLGIITLPILSPAILRLEALIPKRRSYEWR